MEKTQQRELPHSSYEVIHLPTPNGKISPVNKGLGEHQPQAKRQKVVQSVTSQADEGRSKLNAKYPSFTKTLAKSHVSGGFWMFFTRRSVAPQGLPQPFCRMHLPLVDTYFVLEYENGKRYGVKYLAERTAFSGKWREFSLAEKLSEGDVLVFQLVNSAKFKVHRLDRLNDGGLSEVNGVYATLNLDAGWSQTGSNNNDLQKNIKTYQASFPEAVSRDTDHEMILSEEDGEIVENVQKSTPEIVEVDEIVQSVETVKMNSPEYNARDPKHLRFHPTVADQTEHNGIANFDDFISLLDELLKKDYNLPHHIKWSYYQLCSSQRSVLHAGLLKDTNPILLAGCIIETVDIVNAMKTCDLASFDNNFAIWDRKLKSLEALGMDVGFLSARLFNLQTTFRNSEFAKNMQQFMLMCAEHADSELIIKNLQEKLAEQRRVSEKQADDIEKLGKKIKEHERRFQEQVSAPW